MGKHSRKDGERSEVKSNGISNVKKSILVDEAAVDPALASLFATSVSPYSTHHFLINAIES
jgi:nucleolar protein 12